MGFMFMFILKDGWMRRNEAVVRESVVQASRWSS